MREIPHYHLACSNCGVGLTAELAYETAGSTVCPHCYPGSRLHGGAGVAPDPGFPIP